MQRQTRGALAQLARAPALQAGGRGFDPHRLHRRCVRREPVHAGRSHHPSRLSPNGTPKSEGSYFSGGWLSGRRRPPIWGLGCNTPRGFESLSAHNHSMGKSHSGQLRQTINLLAVDLRRFESSPPHYVACARSSVGQSVRLITGGSQVQVLTGAHLYIKMPTWRNGRRGCFRGIFRKEWGFDALRRYYVKFKTIIDARRSESASGLQILNSL